MKSNDILRHWSVYAIGNVAAQSLSFLLVPLYTRCLSPAEFGKLEILTRLGEFLAVCLLFHGLRQVTVLRYTSTEDATQRSRVACGTFIAAAVFGLLGITGALWLGVLGPTSYIRADGDLIVLAVVACILEATNLALLALPQARFESAYYLCITVGPLLGKIVLSWLLLFVADLGLWGLFLASTFCSCLQLVLIVRREWVLHKATLDMRTCGDVILAAACFLPGGVGFFLMNYGDRFLLMNWAEEQEIGIYALGYKLALAVVFFCRTPIAMVWGPLIHHFRTKAGAEIVFGRVVTRVLMIYMFLALGLAILSRPVIVLVAGDSYVSADRYVVPILIAYFFLTAADAMESVFYAAGQLRRKAVVAIISTGNVVGLYMILIPAHQAYGAALATMIGFGVHALLTFAATRPLLRLRLEYARLAISACAAAVLWGLTQMLGDDAGSIAVKVALWLSWPVYLWVLGTITPAERLALRSGVLRLCETLQSWLRPDRRVEQAEVHA